MQQLMRNQLLGGIPRNFDLLRVDGTAQPAKRMNNLSSLPLQERPDLLIIVEEPTRHLQVL